MTGLVPHNKDLTALPTKHGAVPRVSWAVRRLRNVNRRRARDCLCRDRYFTALRDGSVIYRSGRWNANAC